MQSLRSCYPIESLTTIDNLFVDIFIKPAIALMEKYEKNPFPIDIKCQSIPSSDDKEDLPIEIEWESNTFPNWRQLFDTIQRPPIVELSAIAIALILVTQIAKCRTPEVTMRGEKADYYLNDKELMLEVSGTENINSLSPTHKKKIKQLLS